MKAIRFNQTHLLHLKFYFLSIYFFGIIVVASKLHASQQLECLNAIEYNGSLNVTVTSAFYKKELGVGQDSTNIRSIHFISQDNKYFWEIDEKDSFPSKGAYNGEYSQLLNKDTLSLKKEDTQRQPFFAFSNLFAEPFNFLFQEKDKDPAFIIRMGNLKEARRWDLFFKNSNLIKKEQILDHPCKVFKEICERHDDFFILIFIT